MIAKTLEVMQTIHGTDVFANYGSFLPLDLQVEQWARGLP
jgi:hypothetical protein